MQPRPQTTVRGTDVVHAPERFDNTDDPRWIGAFHDHVVVSHRRFLQLRQPRFDTSKSFGLRGESVVCLGATQRQKASELFDGHLFVEQDRNLDEANAEIAERDDAMETTQLLRHVYHRYPVFGSTHTGRSSPISS